MAGYSYLRYSWNPIDLHEAKAELASFKPTWRQLPYSERDASIYRTDRTELVASADTLTAYLKPHSAHLNQRAPAPFTARDLDLRERILRLYPRSRATVFPWGFSHEPPFSRAEATAAPS